MSSSNGTPSTLTARIEAWRHEGVLAERQRIIAWLTEVEKSVKAEPNDEKSGDGFSHEEKVGALGMIVVLKEKLEAS